MDTDVGGEVWGGNWEDTNGSGDVAENRGSVGSEGWVKIDGFIDVGDVDVKIDVGWEIWMEMDGSIDVIDENT